LQSCRAVVAPAAYGAVTGVALAAVVAKFGMPAGKAPEAAILDEAESEERPASAPPAPSV